MPCSRITSIWVLINAASGAALLLLYTSATHVDTSAATVVLCFCAPVVSGRGGRRGQPGPASVALKEHVLHSGDNREHSRRHKYVRAGRVIVCSSPHSHYSVSMTKAGSLFVFSPHLLAQVRRYTHALFLARKTAPVIIIRTYASMSANSLTRSVRFHTRCRPRRLRPHPAPRRIAALMMQPLA